MSNSSSPSYMIITAPAGFNALAYRNHTFVKEAFNATGGVELVRVGDFYEPRSAFQVVLDRCEGFYYPATNLYTIEVLTGPDQNYTAAIAGALYANLYTKILADNGKHRGGISGPIEFGSLSAYGFACNENGLVLKGNISHGFQLPIFSIVCFAFAGFVFLIVAIKHALAWRRQKQGKSLPASEDA